MRITRAWIIDTAERTGATFVVTAVGVWVGPVLVAAFNGGDVPHAIHGVLVTSVAWKAVLAGMAAAGTVIKSAIAPLIRRKRGGGSLSPASLVAPVQPEQEIEGAPPPPRRRWRGATHGPG